MPKKLTWDQMKKDASEIGNAFKEYVGKDLEHKLPHNSSMREHQHPYWGEKK